MIEIKNLNLKINNKKILNGISLTLSEGIHGVLGPNGAGKTTLFRCLAGVYGDYTGSIKITNATGENLKYSIGYLPQKFSLISDLKLYECMEYFALIKGIIKGRNEEIHRCLEMVNLDAYSERKCKELSGGMIRRAGIAQAIMGKPSLILFDEPTVGLDPEERMRFKKICAGIEKQSVVLMSTHVVEDVTVCCDDILVMFEGRIIFEGEESELIGRGLCIDAHSKSTENGYLSVISAARKISE